MNFFKKSAPQPAVNKAGLPKTHEEKASKTGPLIYFQYAGRPVWTAQNYAALVRQGYKKNVVAYRCVRMIAEAVGSTAWQVKQGRHTMSEHPLLSVLKKPNNRQSGSELVESLVGHLMISGNAYIEAVTIDNELRELHALRPDRMKVLQGRDGWPTGYEYSVNGRTVHFDQMIEPIPQILQLTLDHPEDDHYGFGPMAVAQMAIDVHNETSAWNKALLDNAARPSGALVYTGGDGSLTEEQFSRLKEELEESFQGSKNAGRPLLLEGGLDWKAMSLSPRDMDYMQTKNTAARDIALAFGVPPMLLGIPGDNSYANYAEANRAFWRQTILPILRRTSKAMEMWLAPLFGSDFNLSFDESSITALASEKEALWKRIADADFLTNDEKRIALGYDALLEAQLEREADNN